MCGISGIFHKSPTGGETIQKLLSLMIRQQQHRGPDGHGLWISESHGIGLGHNRLAILDPSSAGQQPMHHASGSYTLVYNGEVYNWQSLRAELEQLGHSFSTRTDTEVILAAFSQWGENCVPKFEGMFAFAIFNHKDSTLFLARDRIGKKPLVYAAGDYGFVFGSEIPAVLCTSFVPREINAAALFSMFMQNLRHIPDPLTLYQQIHRLPPGHAMWVKQGCIQKIYAYWRSPIKPDSMGPLALRTALDHAVRSRMVADVPIGVLLSGGIDSTAIAALMQQHSSQPVRSYAMGFDANDEDLLRAQVAAKAIGTEHQELYFDANVQLNTLQKLLATYGEPIALLPLLYSYALAQKIYDDGGRVVLAGHGADELFYGYTGQFRTARLGIGIDFMTPFLPPVGHRKAALYDLVWNSVISKISDEHIKCPLNGIMGRWGEFRGKSSSHYVDEASFVGLMVENQHSIQIAGDLPMMMAGIEMRSPFLDQQIVAYSLHEAWQNKIDFRFPKTLKKVLRQSVADLVPAQLLNAPKRGFGYGIPEWRVLSESWRSAADEAFHNFNDLGGIFSRRKIGRIWQSFCARPEYHPSTALLMKCFVVQVWVKNQTNIPAP